MKEKIESNGAAGRLLDVRTYPEHRAVHVRGARLMPLDRLDPAAVREAFPGDEPVYVLCKSGQRAKRACERLESADLKNLVLVEGIDSTITKTATVVSDPLDTEMHIFR